MVSGYVRSNGTYVAPHYRSDYGSPSAGTGSSYVYRNPYAAEPSVRVQGYTRSSGTYVAPHVRTPANDTVTDNLSYRGYGTIRVPRLMRLGRRPTETLVRNLSARHENSDWKLALAALLVASGLVGCTVKKRQANLTKRESPSLLRSIVRRSTRPVADGR